ncbi:MAG: ferritin-like domain-containing protein [Polyangiales bacterium]
MPNPKPTPDAVELLLRRIAQRSFAGSLLTGAFAVGGCMTAAPAPETPEADVDPPLTREDEPAEVAPVTPSTAPPAPPASSDTRDAGTGTPGTSPDAGALAALRCEAGGTSPVHASGLTLSGTYDSVAIREVRGGIPGRLSDAGSAETWAVQPSVVTLSATGEPCKTATTPACAEKVKGHPTQFVATACAQMCVEHALVTTRGDEVRRWAGKDAIALLGEIDTADDALLLVSYAGYTLRCDDPLNSGIRPVEGGFEVLATRMTKDCAPIVVTAFTLFVGRDGKLEVRAQTERSRQENACVGRMAAHVDVHEPAAGASRLGDYLAHSAQLEAASVHAFAQLARELEAHGAPADLVTRAQAARDDEVRHAAEVGALATARGGMPGAPTVHAQAVRTLDAIAIENAVEGCVRETYGALVGAHQAARARDPGLRAAMGRIADDEARHAALSHAVHAWIVGRLDAGARARVLAAQIKAIGALSCAARTEPEHMLREDAGLPDARTATAMIDQLARELWLPSLAAA